MAKRRADNQLTVLQLKALKAPGYHSDGGGLSLRITATGGKSWVYGFYFQGKEREMGLGVFDPDAAAIAAVREARTAARALRNAGVDPIEARKTEAVEKALALTLPELMTFGPFAKEMVAAMATRSDKYRAQTLRRLTDYIPTLQAKSLAEITTADVLVAMRPHWTRTPEQAERIRAGIERVLDAARVAGHITGAWENPARWRRHLELLLPRPQREVKHYPALPAAQLPAFMATLRGKDTLSAFMLEFTILTLVRTHEVRFGIWKEVVDDVWDIPGKRMKEGLRHRVPLTQPALDVLAKVKPLAADLGALIFPGRKPGVAYSNMAMYHLLENLADDATVHGFRSTFRDWASGQRRFAREHIEMCLAHAVGDATERAYWRDDCLDQRREIMEAWADFCGGKTAEVTPLKGVEERAA